MSKDSVFLADRPSTGYLVSIIFIAAAGSLGLPFMIWLVFTGIFSRNWIMVGAALFSGLICAGMLQSWKSVRSIVRQRRDGSRHSITISGQKFIYRKDDLVQEIPLVDIQSVKDRVEPSGGSQAWTVEISYRKPDESQGQLWINKLDFSNTWEKKDKFSGMLFKAIQENRD